jgi:hypothetical protein
MPKKNTTVATKPAPAAKAKPKGATPRTKAKDATRPAVAAHGANPPKPGKPPKTPHVSALSAAVLVLASAPAEGMTTKAMIDAMVEQKLWASPKGKTPEASLYAAITREIGKKGVNARFKKVDRGHFVLTQAAV